MPDPALDGEVRSDVRSEARSEIDLEAGREPGPAADNRTATTSPQTLEPGTA